MGYAFTDVRALTYDVRAVTGARAGTAARALTDARRPASPPHAGRPVRRDP